MSEKSEVGISPEIFRGKSMNRRRGALRGRRNHPVSPTWFEKIERDIWNIFLNLAALGLLPRRCGDPVG